MQTVTWPWFAGAAASFLALCSVPFLVHAQLAALAEKWAPHLNDASLKTRLEYGIARLWALATGAALLAWGASYLYLVALHVGGIVR